MQTNDTPLFAEEDFEQLLAELSTPDIPLTAAVPIADAGADNRSPDQLVFEDGPDVSGELVRLGRQLTGQYIDVLANYTQAVFSNQGNAGTGKGLHGALTSLIRLADATGDADLLDQLQRLLALTEQGVPTRRTARDRFLRALRERVLHIADCLQDADRDRLRELILYDRAALPLLNEIGNIHGIGPRRLERLYCAGLFTVKRVEAASPEDISATTGIPMTLSERIVATTRAFAESRRRNSVEEMRDRIQVFLNTLPQLDPSKDRALIQSAWSALGQLQEALNRLEADE
ncbi:MAG: helix-hairpin-helix domain-containing protein [Myxococcota bacterium]